MTKGLQAHLEVGLVRQRLDDVGPLLAGKVEHALGGRAQLADPAGEAGQALSAGVVVLPAGELVLERQVSVQVLPVHTLDVLEGGVIQAVGAGAGQQMVLFGRAVEYVGDHLGDRGSIVIGCQFCSGVPVMAAEPGAPAVRHVYRSVAAAVTTVVVVPHQREERRSRSCLL
ncbi:hypothetical protein [Kutzneria buriramensis]|uniref:hypothetical protein n=1 Tax=Kutzneria buriramensis TaxID=1045776 RepID=UPI000E25D182|nr:hypothetical protein [Kutzneria buriramensis]